MMVDYRKRAERRRAFYERMKQDPTQFLRLYGQKCKIHIDPQLAAAGDGKSVMMPWQGDSNNMIDRFDVRAHLDMIPPQPPSSSIGPLMETDPEEHRLNYERYRTLVMIDSSGATEESYIRQLEIEEMYGVKRDDDKKEKEKSLAKATIGFTYDNSIAGDLDKDDGDSESDSDSVLSDIDVTVDVDEIDEKQRETLDSRGLHYGMASAQFCRKLKEDKDEIEEQRRLRQEEEERSLVTGRRAKRERRSMRERQRKRAHDLEQSPPSYARKASPTYESYGRSPSRSSSRSPSPEDPGKVEFITEFSHDNTANQPSKKPDGDSQSHTSSSRSVHFTLLSSACVLLFRLTVRTWRFLRYFLLILPSLIVSSADYQRLS